jgi:hypothetical protein
LKIYHLATLAAISSAGVALKSIKISEYQCYAPGIKQKPHLSLYEMVDLGKDGDKKEYCLSTHLA